MRKRLHFEAALVAAVTLLSVPALAQFNPGEIFYVGTDGQIFECSAGGDLSGSLFVDTAMYSSGQLAWSHDRQTMYVAHTNHFLVTAIDSQGNVVVHATGLDRPTGLLMTTDGVLLTAEYDTGEITDITTAGDFTGVVPLTDGLSSPRHMLQMPDGSVRVANQLSGEVFDALYPGGGTVGIPLATLPADIASMIRADDGTIWATTEGFVWDITAGGDLTAAAPFAQGQQFWGLTVAQDGALLANGLFSSEIFDISMGGDFSMAPPFAFGLSLGETSFGTVPPAVCGNGAVEIDEPCDDGNESNEDACLDVCEEATCGDGFTWDGMEECDDSNTEDGDGCSSTCTLEGMGAGGAGGSTTSAGGDGTGTGGNAGTGGSSSDGGGDLTPGGDVEETGGCSMGAPARGDVAWWALLGLLGAGTSRRRRRS
jgi:MYXO-CTERM domain-containing protein